MARNAAAERSRKKQTDRSLEQEIAELLIENKMTVTTAESCTGGLLAGRLINAAGISTAYKQGYITYANEAKHKLLGVKNKTLKKHGAVSRQTAKQMAKGAAKAAKADAAVSVTGIAGPDGGTKEKPVGLVYVGCCVRGEVEVKEYHFSGSRSEIRQATVESALVLLRDCILKQLD